MNCKLSRSINFFPEPASSLLIWRWHNTANQYVYMYRHGYAALLQTDSQGPLFSIGNLGVWGHVFWICCGAAGTLHGENLHIRFDHPGLTSVTIKNVIVHPKSKLTTNALTHNPRKEHILNIISPVMFGQLMAKYPSDLSIFLHPSLFQGIFFTHYFITITISPMLCFWRCILFCWF